MNKTKVKEVCERVVEAKITGVKQAMIEAQLSANSETKSSMGDKYETSRAMAQQENDRLAGQLEQWQRLKHALAALDTIQEHQEIGTGSYVRTEQGDFYLSVGLGEVKGDEVKCYAIALHSPVGQSLSGKRKGDVFRLGEREVTILAVY